MFKLKNDIKVRKNSLKTKKSHYPNIKSGSIKDLKNDQIYLFLAKEKKEKLSMVKSDLIKTKKVFMKLTIQ